MARRVQHLFIVRIWLEQSGTAAASQWRGAVEHVRTGQRFYFTSLGDLQDFITRWLEDPALRQDLPPRKKGYSDDCGTRCFSS